MRAAVLYINGDSADLSGYLTEKLTARLVNDSGLIIVDGTKRLYRRFGKQLGAQALITGSLKKRGQLYRLDLRAIDAESGRIMGSRITENIRGDGAWAARLQTRAGLAFQGDALTERNKRTLYQGVRNAAWKYGVSIELRTYPTS